MNNLIVGLILSFKLLFIPTSGFDTPRFVSKWEKYFRRHTSYPWIEVVDLGKNMNVDWKQTKSLKLRTLVSKTDLTIEWLLDCNLFRCDSGI